ncbi:NAD(P)-binding Rossmann-fold superfamily protein isoform X2 [Tasmannia lanceolata]|uniref:NAD(P)-binding Rossmann-fold superfamily protein isoform X2 n=1 Tax=Tasmannia lanceolata TaxID=3420 RepID=UPI004063348B
MEFLSLHSSPLHALPFSSERVFAEKHCFFSGQILPIPKCKRSFHASNLKFVDSRAQPSGSLQGANASKQGIPKAVMQEMQSKDSDLAFVAGATGKVGSRTVRELLKLGFRVRAGVRSPQKAEALVQSVKEMRLDDITSTSETPPVERLEIVECDLEKRDEIRPAIDNASVVICCIGASEKEVFDVTGPYRIDYQASKNLIDAASVAKVNHFILLTSLGTNKIGFPAAILNLFWGVLIWKRKAEEALISSGIPYTIVRPGGMERPTDAYKETHNIVLASEDTYFGGQVSNLQVAELMAFMAKNRNLSYCKVVEVIAETTAPLTPMGDLLAKIPSQKGDYSSLKGVKTDSKPDPTPSQSKATRIVAELEPIQSEVKKTRPLSPYIAYDDLKPPTSPTPTPSTTPGGPKESHVNVVHAQPVEKIILSEPEIGIVEEELVQAKVQKASPLSPYVTYDDFKPPSSPTPSVPSVSVNLKSTTSSEKPVNKQHLKPQNSRPLSPYTMYEDMKPPTTPTPSPKRS